MVPDLLVTGVGCRISGIGIEKRSVAFAQDLFSSLRHEDFCVMVPAVEFRCEDMRDRTEAFADSIGAEGDGFSVHFPKEERAVLDPLPDLSEIGIAGSDIHLKFVVEIREPVREKIDVSFCAPVEGSLDVKT